MHLDLVFEACSFSPIPPYFGEFPACSDLLLEFLVQFKVELRWFFHLKPSCFYCLWVYLSSSSIGVTFTISKLIAGESFWCLFIMLHGCSIKFYPYVWNLISSVSLLHETITPILSLVWISQDKTWIQNAWTYISSCLNYCLLALLTQEAKNSSKNMCIIQPFHLELRFAGCIRWAVETV